MITQQTPDVHTMLVQCWDSVASRICWTCWVGLVTPGIFVPRLGPAYNIRQRYIDKLNKIERSLARFVSINCKKTSSVTYLIQN